MEEITDRQYEVLNFIRDFIERYRFPPTRAEIAKAFKFNPNAAEEHLQALAKKGALVVHRGIARGITLQ